MKRFITMIGAFCVIFFFSFGSSFSNIKMFGDSPQTNESSINTSRNVNEEFRLKWDDEPEVAYKKIVDALKVAEKDEAYCVPVNAYPEQKWYKLLDLLNDFFTIPYCEKTRKIGNDVKSCEPEYSYILIIHK